MIPSHLIFAHRPKRLLFKPWWDVLVIKMQFTCRIKSLFAYLNLPKATAFPSQEQWSKDQYKGELGAIWSCKHNSSLLHSFETGGPTLHAIWWVNKRGKGSCFGRTYRRKWSSHSRSTLLNVPSPPNKAFPDLKDVFNANSTNRSICIQILSNHAVGEIFIPGVIMTCTAVWTVWLILAKKS